MNITSILKVFKRKPFVQGTVSIPLSLTFKSIWDNSATKQLTSLSEHNSLVLARKELAEIDMDKSEALYLSEKAYELQCKEAKTKYERHMVELATQYDTRKRELEGVVAKLSIN
jgi:hypothetical protein